MLKNVSLFFLAWMNRYACDAPCKDRQANCQEYTFLLKMHGSEPAIIRRVVAANGEHAHMQPENERWLNRDARCGRVLVCMCANMCTGT